MGKPDLRNRQDIEKVIDHFYETACHDDLLAPVFAELDRSRTGKQIFYDYWSDALLNEQRHDHRDFPAHIGSMFSQQHFVRWLRLFLETMDLLYAGPNVERAKVIVIRRSEEFQASLEISPF